MPNNKIMCFVGSSGTGKTTLLNYLKEKFDAETVELSGRGFLSNASSYDVQVEDTIQSQIAYFNTSTILLKMLEIKGNSKAKITCFSRSPIDVMAYELTLNKSKYLLPLQTKVLQQIKDNIIWIYLPIEFPLSDKSDIKRGLNEEVRNLTDENIKDLLFENEINYYTLRGSIEERQKELNYIIETNFNN